MPLTWTTNTATTNTATYAATTTYTIPYTQYTHYTAPDWYARYAAAQRNMADGKVISKKLEIEYAEPPEVDVDDWAAVMQS